MNIRQWFANYFDMMWEDRPWWFNLFVAWPVLIVCFAFAPTFNFRVQLFKRLVDGMCGALGEDFCLIYENHKLDQFQYEAKNL